MKRRNKKKQGKQVILSIMTVLLMSTGAKAQFIPAFPTFGGISSEDLDHLILNSNNSSYDSSLSLTAGGYPDSYAGIWNFYNNRNDKSLYLGYNYKGPGDHFLLNTHYFLKFDHGGDLSLKGKVGIDQTSPKHLLDLGNSFGKKLALFEDEDEMVYNFYGLGANPNLLEFHAGATSAGDAPDMVLQGGGNVGIGTVEPMNLLDLGDSLGKKLAVYQQRNGNHFYGFGISSATLEFYANASPGRNPDMVLMYDINSHDVNVGIGLGTDAPSEKLEVNGNVKATGFIVEADNDATTIDTDIHGLVVLRGETVDVSTIDPQFLGDGNYSLFVEDKMAALDIAIADPTAYEAQPDYVFESDYELPSLESVEAFVKEHHHLEGIPSKAEVAEKQGWSLPKMDQSLLKKVEELTLYTIDQEKRIKAQDEKIMTLQNMLERLLDHKKK